MNELPINTIIQADVLEGVKEIPDESIDTIITSPPYWGLRDYKVEGQWGLEENFNLWIDKMLKLTLDLNRVLKKSGTFWLNIGDTYFGSYGNNEQTIAKHKVDLPTKSIRSGDYYQSKCLTMIPERLALGMIDQGWILRNKIIWHKPNAMPASVRDRLKNSYEVVYLFTKNNQNIQWSNWYTGKGALKKPKQQYLDFDGKTILDHRKWKCDNCGVIGETKESLDKHRCDENEFNNCHWTEHLWEGMDYYFDLDAIRVPAKTEYSDYKQRPKTKNFELIDDNSANIIRSRRKQDNKPISKLFAEIAEETFEQGLTREEQSFNLQESQKKQDNVPSKNASLYKGFNQRWKELAENKYGGDQQHHIGGRVQAYMNEVQGSNIAGANPGDVWTIATQSFKEAHFATFPEKLIEPMILAGCPKQICSKCGFVRERLIKTDTSNTKGEDLDEYNNPKYQEYLQQARASEVTGNPTRPISNIFNATIGKERETIGWSKCNCEGEDRWKAGVVLDPFGGSGTVAVVAQRLNSNWILIELKKEYCDMAYNRIFKGSKPLERWT